MNDLTAIEQSDVESVPRGWDISPTVPTTMTFYVKSRDGEITTFDQDSGDVTNNNDGTGSWKIGVNALAPGSYTWWAIADLGVNGKKIPKGMEGPLEIRGR